MNQNQLLANRLREVFLSGKWIANTNCKEQIESISWEEAIVQVANLNTIASLVFHLNYYLSGLIHAFENGKLEISDRFSFDMKPILSQSDWDSLKNEFLRNAIRFSSLVETLDDELLISHLLMKSMVHV